jgi:hypothetical protein
VKLFPAGWVGRAMMNALLAGSVRVNASPIAYPDKARELIHSEFMMVAFQVRLKLALELGSLPSSTKIVGAIRSGFEVELNVPL